MTFRRSLVSSAAIGALALVTACASPSARDDRYASAPVPSSAAYAEYGQVRAIDVVPVASRSSGAGAILGAVVGAVVGNQFGSGSGRAAATVGGAVAGGLAGNAIERRQKRDDEVFRVSVRFDNGNLRDFDFRQIDELRVGDRVRLENGQLYRS